MKTISKKDIEELQAVKLKLNKTLVNHQDIMGIGIGYRKRKGKLINQLCIRIYIRKKFLSHLLPKKRILPKEYKGVQIDIIEGNYDIHTDHSKRFNPLIGGIQIGNINNYPRIGTLGCFAKDVESDQILLLSNWHVLYGRVRAKDNEAIVQPRPIGTSGNIIGFTVKGILNDRVDCALAKIESIRNIKDEIYDLPNKILGVTEAKLGMRVIKSGVSGLANGIIDDIDLDITLNYPIGERRLKNQIHISPSEKDFFDIDEGDSGSVWISEKTNKIVGLHIGGIYNTRAVANHIFEVIDAFSREGIEISFDT